MKQFEVKIPTNTVTSPSKRCICSYSASKNKNY